MVEVYLHTLRWIEPRRRDIEKLIQAHPAPRPVGDLLFSVVFVSAFSFIFSGLLLRENFFDNLGFALLLSAFSLCILEFFDGWRSRNPFRPFYYFGALKGPLNDLDKLIVTHRRIINYCLLAGIFSSSVNCVLLFAHLFRAAGAASPAEMLNQNSFAAILCFYFVVILFLIWQRMRMRTLNLVADLLLRISLARS
jgi:hypothetical protein